MQNDYDHDPAGNPRDETTVMIPIHRVAQWYWNWKSRRDRQEKEHIQEYEDIVRNYKQDL